MKILNINKFHYKKGGSETYYFALNDAFKKNGHEIINFSMKSDKNLMSNQSEFFVENIDYNTIKGFKKMSAIGRTIYSKSAKHQIEKLIEKEKPDLAILNLVHRQLTMSVVDGIKKYGIPIFFVTHDLIFVCPDYKMLCDGKICEKCLKQDFRHCIKNRCIKNSKLKSIIGYLEAKSIKRRKLYDKVDLYIAPSNFYKNKLEEGKFTTKPIIYHKNFLPIDTQYDNHVIYGDYFLFIGRLSQEKGLMILLQSIKEMKDVTLKIAGAGPLKAEIEKYIAANDLSSRVTLMGFVSGESLIQLVKECKSVIVPSQWYENAPYSVMEAMAAGKPLIVSDIGGLPELVENGKNGYLYKPFDKEDLKDKIQLIKNLNLNDYQTMARYGIEKAKNEFDADQYVEFILDEYKKVKER